jgi:hypothetical protein
MEAVPLPHLEQDPEPRFVEIAKDQPEYLTLPALVYTDGKILTEWKLSEEERARIAQGENIRLWVWVYPVQCEACGAVRKGRLQPVALEVTTEHGA